MPQGNEEQHAAMQPLAGTKVLLAEDNPINMAVVKRLLAKWGLETAAAVNGREAVERSENTRYDILLLDLEMPGLDGVSALKEIRKMDPEVPAIAFTAATYENIKEDLREKGFNDIISKPFLPEDLRKKIGSLLAASKRA